MKVIIEGSEHEVSKIVKENAVRVRRGLVTISPISEEGEDANPIIEDEHPIIDEDKKAIIEDDKKVVIDDEKSIVDDEKTPKRARKPKKVIED